MSDFDEVSQAADDNDQPSGIKSQLGIVRNIGEPIRLNNLRLCGVSSHAAQASENVEIWTRLALTSDDISFHRIVENFELVIAHHTQQVGASVRLSRSQTVLLVIKDDETAELWVDTAAVAIQCMIKRNMLAGSAIFENDIADVTGMSFPCVHIEQTDQVVCIFRQDWRFALFFDFNPDRNLSVESVTKTLGALYRNLKYRHLYDAVADEAVFAQLVTAGWFPFVEVITSEFRKLMDYCEAGLDLVDAEIALLTKFDDDRLERMFVRWIAKPHFAAKEQIFRAAIDAYKDQKPIPVIKILLTEIEGVLMEAYRAVHGKGAKVKTLLAFAVESAEQKTGQADTLLFPAAFAKYLDCHTFANFDPVAEDGTASSRHAVGHGVAQADSYTLVRALQAILTLDQIAFYT